MELSGLGISDLYLKDFGFD